MTTLHYNLQETYYIIIHFRFQLLHNSEWCAFSSVHLIEYLYVLVPKCQIVFNLNSDNRLTNWLLLQARVGDECVGAIGCKLDYHKKVVKRGYIAMLAVDSKFRKRAIGSTLVQKAIEAMNAQEADEVGNIFMCVA